MTQIMLDAAMQCKLNNLKESLELCDESGKVLAHLFPVVDPSQYERFEPVITPEELQRRRLEPDLSTAEVLSHLVGWPWLSVFAKVRFASICERSKQCR